MTVMNPHLKLAYIVLQEFLKMLMFSI